MSARRRGFALLFVLWVLASGSALAIALGGIGRDEIGAIRQRMSTVRGQWAAFGCADQFRARLEETMWADGFSAASVSASWQELDRLPVASSCHVELTPSGMAVDANAASRDQLRRLLSLAGFDSGAADSVARSVVEWRDLHGPFRAVEQVRVVSGLSPAITSRRILGVLPERILWRRADRAVIGTLPGMTDEAIAVLDAHGRDALTDLSALADLPELSIPARDSLRRGARALIPQITTTVESWTIRASAAGVPPITVAVRVQLGDGHLSVVERRILP